MSAHQRITLAALCFVLGVALAQERPHLDIQPQTVNKEVGSSLALTCRPKADKPSDVTQLEWMDSFGRKIEPIRSNPLYTQPHTGEPGIVLIFDSITENQGGNYTCQANYAGMIIQNFVMVKTYVDIKFVDAPTSQFPVMGKDFSIKCKVNGNPSPIVDWNKNGERIDTNDRYVVSNDELLIKNVTEADDGVYKCTAVVLSTGQIKTRDIKVEVQIPPKIVPMDIIEVIEGETASTKCTAHGKPPPAYKWIKERTREDLAVTDRFDVKKNTGELIINRVEFNDDSYYRCTAENQAGTDSTRVKINVLVKPQIYELLNVTTPVTKETKLICKTKGRPIPTVTFRKLSSREPLRLGAQLNDKRIVLEQKTFEDKAESFAVLTISDLKRQDDGLYECVAENKAGAAYKNGHIAVEFAPTFERFNSLPPVWAWQGKPGNLSCIPEAIPNATITWKMFDIELKNNSNFLIINQGPISNLIVYPDGNDKFYTKYECIARNTIGTNSTGIFLKQGKIPLAINQVRPERITATTIKFSIVPPNAFDELPIKSYTVRYRPERQLAWDYAMNHTWSSGAPYILENLIPEATYHFKFAARNDVGMGPFINVESVTMPRRSEPAEPKILVEDHNIRDQMNNQVNREDILTYSQYADHYELRWNVPNDNGDPIQHYLIRYCEVTKVNGHWHDSQCSEHYTQSVQYTSFQLNNLRPDTVYKIELRAHNAIGDSSPAQIKVRTAKGLDTAVPFEKPAMSSTLIIGIVIGAVLLVLIIVDLTCFCFNRMGILAYLCSAKSKHHDEEDPKLGREEREPLRSNVNGEKPMSVEYDGKQVYTKSGEIIGKNSAV